MESFQWPTPTHPNRFDGVQPPTFHPPAHTPSTHPPTPLEIYLTKLVNNEENITIPALPPPSLPPSSTSIHQLTHLFKRFFVSVERQNAKIESPPPPHFFFVMSIALNLSLTDPNIWEKVRRYNSRYYSPLDTHVKNKQINTLAPPSPAAVPHATLRLRHAQHAKRFPKPQRHQHPHRNLLQHHHPTR